MPTSPRDSKLQIDLLNVLSSRKTAATETPNESRDSRSSTNQVSLDSFYPQAATIRFQGQTCRMIASQVELGGQRKQEAYACPTPRTVSHGELSKSLTLLGGDARWGELDLDSLAFIDTETTGLAGGSGTYVFLIGVGRFEKEKFVVRQYFMEDYTQEEALVEAVSADLSTARALVSYNGKSFDVPLMQTRWRMNRRQPTFPDLHLDLLHPARRLWRSRLPDCRLGTVEQHILGITRTSDIESALIPWVYFDFLRGERPERIMPVIDHHAQDIFSLGALLMHMADATGQPTGTRHAHESDQSGLARILSSAGRVEDALECMRRAVELATDDEQRFRRMLQLARATWREGLETESVAIWERSAAETLSSGRMDRLEPLIELAKYYEHRLKDFSKAHQWTSQALNVTRSHEELGQWLGTPRTETRTRELIHRLQRLERRIGGNLLNGVSTDAGEPSIRAIDTLPPAHP